MAKKPSITTVASGYQSTTTINSNTQNLRDAFDNTLSLDGSTPNAMLADFDMNSNDIINVDKLYLSGLYIDGQPVAPGTLNYNGVIKETQTATSGQTVFNLTTMTYNPGINSLSVYVDGVYQNPSTYTENNSTRITFSAGLHVGAIVDFVALSINEITGAADASSVTYTPTAQSLYGSSVITVKSALDQISNQSTGSSKVGFLQSGTGVTNRTVQAKLRDTVSVKDFGAVGDGTADDTAAFNAAIAWANAKGGTDRANVPGSTILIPDGRYRITAGLNSIDVSSVVFTGVSSGSAVLVISATAPVFTFKGVPSSYTVVGGGLQNVKIEYPSDPTGGACVVAIDYAFGIEVRNLVLERSATLLRLGETSSRIAGGIVVDNIIGSTANVGIPVFSLRYGAGLFVSNCRTFVRGIPVPSHPNPMPTALGAIVFACGTGFWDTLQVTNCTFERYDIGFSAEVGAGVVVQNAFFDNVIFDFLKRFGFYLNTNGVGAAISNILVGKTCWYNAWEESSVFINNTSGYLDNCSFSGSCAISGKYAVYYNVNNAQNNRFIDMTVNGANRDGTVGSALQFQPGSTGFTVINVKGNDDASLAWTRPAYGIVVTSNCDRYIVSNCQLLGPTGGYAVGANSAGSKNRRFSNNINASYAVTSTATVPASTVTYTNTTPFVEEWQFFGGTITGGYDKNGVGLPGSLPYLTFRLQPGETYAVGYSVAPTAVKSIEN